MADEVYVHMPVRDPFTRGYVSFDDLTAIAANRAICERYVIERESELAARDNGAELNDEARAIVFALGSKQF